MSECSGRHTRSAKSVRNERGEAKGDGMLPKSGGPYLHRSIVRALYIFLSVCVCVSRLCGYNKYSVCVCVCVKMNVFICTKSVCAQRVCVCVVGR